MRNFDKASDRLASLIEMGHLKAATDPAEFLDAAADEIVWLREILGKVVGCEVACAGCVDTKNSEGKLEPCGIGEDAKAAAKGLRCG